jgi:hypothetical protein
MTNAFIRTRKEEGAAYSEIYISLKRMWWLRHTFISFSPEYFGFPCQSSFHQILHHHNHQGQATIGQSVAAVPSGPSWTPPPIKRIKKNDIQFVFNTSFICINLIM